MVAVVGTFAYHQQPSLCCGKHLFERLVSSQLLGMHNNTQAGTWKKWWTEIFMFTSTSHCIQPDYYDPSGSVKSGWLLNHNDLCFANDSGFSLPDSCQLRSRSPVPDLRALLSLRERGSRARRHGHHRCTSHLRSTVWHELSPSG